MKEIKDFRMKNGWTQTDLADKAGLSLRTIQRVESGQSIPKGHTLKVLSDVFGVKPSEFEYNNASLGAEHIEKLKFINISALAVIIIPFGNIVFPFFLWRRSRKDHVINQIGKYILNFQIIWTLLLSLLLLISPVVQDVLQLPFSLILVVLVLCYGVNVWIIFRFSKWIAKGDVEQLKVTYQLL